MLKLFDYQRSSAAYRVRIALALKGLDYTKSEVHLLRDGGEQHKPEYKAVNPQSLVPALEIDGAVRRWSVIIEYLDETRPTPPLLPRTPKERALVRAMALTVAAEIHPIQNTRVQGYLRQKLAQPDDAVLAFVQHWITTGLKAMEELVKRSPQQGAYCFGSEVTVADICLAPQMVNARRYKCDVSSIQRLVDIDTRLRALPAFAQTTSET